jgi:hypothetical protein
MNQIEQIEQAKKVRQTKHLIMVLGIWGTVGAVYLLCWCYALFPSLFKFQYPTAIPSISEQERCQQSGKTWQEGKCLDFDHNRNF